MVFLTINIYLQPMKLILFSLFSFSFTCSIRSQVNYSVNILNEREIHQKEFVENILDSTEKANFQGICYFDIDTNFIVEAKFTRKKGKKFIMPMSKKRTVYYRKYGELSFTVNDTICILQLYENLSLKGNKEFKDYLFLPFKDKTTGKSTYDAGRYLDVYKSKNVIWIIDFNKAYQPYCAYSDRYSCPIVPQENSISVAILAGECYEGKH